MLHCSEMETLHLLGPMGGDTAQEVTFEWGTDK